MMGISCIEQSCWICNCCGII